MALQYFRLLYCNLCCFTLRQHFTADGQFAAHCATVCSGAREPPVARCLPVRLLPPLIYFLYILWNSRSLTLSPCSWSWRRRVCGRRSSAITSEEFACHRQTHSHTYITHNTLTYIDSSHFFFFFLLASIDLFGGQEENPFESPFWVYFFVLFVCLFEWCCLLQLYKQMLIVFTTKIYGVINYCRSYASFNCMV